MVPHTADTVLVALLKGIVLLDLNSGSILHNLGQVPHLAQAERRQLLMVLLRLIATLVRF